MGPDNLERKVQAASEAPHIEWCVHPLRERPVSAACLTAFLLVLHGLIYVVLEHWLYVLIAAMLLLPSLAPFFLPVRYSLYSKHIVVATPIRRFSRPWAEFQRYEVDRNGLFLSPFAAPSRLDRFRGMYLRFGVHRDEVLRFLRNHSEEMLPC